MSASIRLHVEDPLAAGAVLTAAPDQAHYLGTVMRCVPGDTVAVFNGRDGEWVARIARLKRDRAELVVEALRRPQAPGADLWLVFALLKRTAADFLVQKATELGAAALLPVTTARTNAERLNPERVMRIAREAAEQSGRLDLPRLATPCSLAALLASWPAGRTLHAAVERSDAPRMRPAGGSIPRPAALLVGPEGGFTPAELDALHAAPFVLAGSLGPLILRAETAAIAGLALLQASD